MLSTKLTPDNYALFKVIRDQLNQRPPISIEATARGLGVTVDELCRWFIGFKEPRKPRILPPGPFTPRDPHLRAELGRLRDREASLVTVSTEAPEQLGRVQSRIRSLERMR